jgi:hypothetical protein
MVLPSDARLPLVVVVLGILVGVPLLFLPGASGSVAFGTRLMQAIAVVGVGVVGAVLYSSRTGDVRPAVATGLTLIGLIPFLRSPERTAKTTSGTQSVAKRFKRYYNSSE